MALLKDVAREAVDELLPLLEPARQDSIRMFLEGFEPVLAFEQVLGHAREQGIPLPAAPVQAVADAVSAALKAAPGLAERLGGLVAEVQQAKLA